MPDLLSAPAGPGALSAPAPQHGEVPPGRISTDAALSVPLLPSFGPGSCATQGQSSEACTFPPHHAAPGPIPSAGSGCGAAGPDTSDDALPPPTQMDPRLGARPVRIDATRTAYAVYSGAEQPPLGAHSVCFVPPLTQAHAVTRDSRNRARRKRKVRSPYQREEDRYNLYLKLGDYRSASRTPDTFTRGPSPSNTTNNHYQLGFMTQDAGAASSTYWTPGPCTGCQRTYSMSKSMSKFLVPHSPLSPVGPFVRLDPIFPQAESHRPLLESASSGSQRFQLYSI